jgi:cytosine deaminase
MAPDLGFLGDPGPGPYRLGHARVPACLLPAGFAADGDGLAAVDLMVEAGRIAAATPAGAVAVPDGVRDIPLGGRMVLPGLVEAHTHLDKGHIWPRRRNPDGTFAGALEAVGADRVACWSAEDVRARMTFALRSAYAHGTTTIRTHIDSIAPQHRISWPVLTEVAAEWRGRIDLEGASLVGVDRALDAAFLADLAGLVAASGGVLGAVTYMVPELAAGLDALFATATRLGLDLDFHVDESEDPAAASLAVIAETALRHRFAGKILVGHCCSLARQDAATVDRTLDLVAAAGIGVVSLPMCNLYLQDRHAGRTPRWRGVTLLHEMAARGIPVMVSSDNTRDPFYAYGDLDGLEVYREATRILHLDHPIGDWPAAITATPATQLRRDAAGRIAVGGPADLVVTRARAFSELLSRPQSDRTVLRAGRAIDRTLPDYADLDPYVAPDPADP